MKRGCWGAGGDSVFKRRSATRGLAAANRGLKPTATIVASLRDEGTAGPGKAMIRDEGAAVPGKTTPSNDGDDMRFPGSCGARCFMGCSLPADGVQGGGRAGGEAAAIAGLVQFHGLQGAAGLKALRRVRAIQVGRRLNPVVVRRVERR